MALTLDGTGFISGVSGLSASAAGCTGGTTSDLLVSGVAYRVHRFDSTGSFYIPESAGTVTVEYTVVGGGGGSTGGTGGTNYGAGGAGGTVRTGTISLVPGSYTATVGAGGVGNSAGGSSSISIVTATGGGTPGTGRTGGANADFSGFAASAGTDSGGGAGAGLSATTGAGGSGITSNITGSPVVYGGGGGGVTVNVGQPGGSGGGGAGSGSIGTNGTSGRGGGAGGCGIGNTANGGSGAVILRYVTSSYVPLGGLTLLATTPFAAVSSVSINDCFSSTYDDYLINITGIGDQAASTGLAGRLRASGVDHSAANYHNAGTYVTHAGGPTRDYAVGGTYMLLGYAGNVYDFSCSAVIKRPALATAKSCHTQYNAYGGSTAVIGTSSTAISSSVAYDGITVYGVAGTITGIVRVYGYTQ